MKRLFLCTLLTATSMQAMEDVRIEPFNHQTHSKAVIEIFKKTFPNTTQPAALKSQSSRPPNERFDVLVHKSGETLGFAIHYIETDTVSNYLNREHKIDLTQRSPALSTVDIKRKDIDWIGIHPNHQGLNYGTMLLTHIENDAILEECSLMHLESPKITVPFYIRFGYHATDPLAALAKMIKPLNALVTDLLAQKQPVESENPL